MGVDGCCTALPQPPDPPPQPSTTRGRETRRHRHSVGTLPTLPRRSRHPNTDFVEAVARASARSERTSGFHQRGRPLASPAAAEQNAKTRTISTGAGDGVPSRVCTVRGYVQHARVCTVCTSIYSMREYVQYVGMYSMRGYVQYARVCTVCVGMYNMREYVQFHVLIIHAATNVAGLHVKNNHCAGCTVCTSMYSMGEYVQHGRVCKVALQKYRKTLAVICGARHKISLLGYHHLRKGVRIDAVLRG